MDLRKEIQVALNNCQPNTNRVDKMVAIAEKYAELYHALQLLQSDVSSMLCGSFDPDNKTSSATKCKCGREKWEHPKPRN